MHRVLGVVTAFVLIAITSVGGLIAAEPSFRGRRFGGGEGIAVDMDFHRNPALPDVLILGDSISIGYTPFVRSKLKGVANVFRPLQADGKKPMNCSSSANGLKLLIPGWKIVDGG